MDLIDKLIHEAIDKLENWPDDFQPPVTHQEVAALHEIYNSEGFGGRENVVQNTRNAKALAEDRLIWLREMREEGLRRGGDELNAQIEAATREIFRELGIDASSSTIREAVKNARKVLPPRLYKHSTKETQIKEVASEAAEYAIFAYPVYPSYQEAFKRWQLKNCF